MIKRIGVENLSLGMYVVKLSGSWMDHPFWRKAFSLTKAEDLKRIQEAKVAFVWIDTKKGDDIAPPVPALPEDKNNLETLQDDETFDPLGDNLSVSPAILSGVTSFDAEFKQAQRICNKAGKHVEDMFQEVRLGKAVNAEASVAIVKEISASMARNQQALISIARLKTHDTYTFLHSVAVCALMAGLAKELNHDEVQIIEAGIAGMLHDLGKALMPLDILNKPGKLTDNEFSVIKSHPVRGHEILHEAGGHREPTLDVVLHHHERVDGTGYPDKLSGDDLTEIARISAICDVYDAITSNRPYKSGWDPAGSMRRMASWQGHFDPKIFQAFVKSVGIYPMGALVQLESCRLGVVVEQRPDALLSPKVKVFYSVRSKAPIKIQIVDLAAASCQDKIISVEENGKWKFPDLESLWLPRS